ncbi:MAG: pseudouridine-5'-phosphate glycosidase [Phycisphaerales bacterium]|nr:pseudouridine-5'-phosphate glycosidase [Phycisphaerales bacterium]
MSSAINIAPEITQAVQDGCGIVGLETAVLTKGLPKTPCHLPQPPHDLDGVALPWHEDEPGHLQTLGLIKKVVVESGCVPAITAVIDGVVHVGLNDDQLRALAENDDAGKVAVTDLAPAIAQKRTAGTTVSGTLAALAMASKELDCCIDVMATGGIGGVHRGWAQQLDVSADLTALSKFRGCVVCAGPKSILDVEATRELLETLCVPIIGYQTHRLPRFLAAGTDAAFVSQRLDQVNEIADVYRLHCEVVPGSGSMLVVNDPPEATRLAASDLEALCQEAEAATDSGAGPARTPSLLAELHGNTQGRSLTANISVLIANAQLAGRIASA